MGKRHLAILGSTGSIGTQALEVISAHPDLFEIDALTTFNRIEILIKQAKHFVPKIVVVVNKEKYPTVKEALASYPIRVLAGAEALEEAANTESTDMVLSAMVGYAGLFPAIKSIRAGKILALANKETLVVAGNLVMNLAKKNGVTILPVDSEHSAIFQCLLGEQENPVEKIILTASGGPFRNLSAERLKTVTSKEALNHPNWCMGSKVTIDSATLMNKGLEIIEARWLFNVPPDQIEVIVHPQSIIHSMVQFHDGSVKAQMGVPDMRLPIQFALGYPNRLKSDFPRVSFSQYSSLTFESPDVKRFPCLQIAVDCLRKGGNLPCIMNAANEIAVEAFLQNRIPFTKIPDIINSTLEKSEYIAEPDLESYQVSDQQARERAKALI